MNVLSLFDGISCARVALDRAGLPVGTYTACEIEPNAIKVSQRNYPDIVRLGDVCAVKGFPVDLLIGGSPCGDLSIAKRNREGLEGSRSKLFWEYVRLKKECNPTWFVLENVASMPKADRDIITREMGVEPVMLNASLVSAQSRKRLFWTNLPVTQPADRGIVLKDILQPEAEVDAKFTIKSTTYTPSPGVSKALALVFAGYVEGGVRKGMEGQEHLSRAHRNPNRVYSTEGKAPTLSASETSGRNLIKVGHIGTSDAQGNRVYSSEGKSVTLSANGGGLGAKTGLYTTGAAIRGNTRTETPDGIKYSDKVDVRPDQKANALTPTFSNKLALVADELRIRKLTPIECERLQGLPDNYTEGIAKTNRYRCLGNAFNVDIVAHILSYAKM